MLVETASALTSTALHEHKAPRYHMAGASDQPESTYQYAYAPFTLKQLHTIPFAGVLAPCNPPALAVKQP